MADMQINVTYLTGHLKLEPVVYRYIDHGDGTGSLETDYGTMGGLPHRELLDAALTAGIRPIIMPTAPLSAAPRRWWQLWR